MSMEDFFEILGIENKKDVSWNEIKAKFSEKVFETHPDYGGRAEDFIKIYESYQYIRKNYTSKNGDAQKQENDFEIRNEKLSKEMVEEIKENIFSKYIVPEINYFSNKSSTLKEYFKELKENKDDLFIKNIFNNSRSLLESDVDLLKGEIFNSEITGRSWSYLENFYNEILSEKSTFDKKLFEKYVLLTKPLEEIVGRIPLNGKNIKGLNLIVDFEAPPKIRNQKLKKGYSLQNIFGKEFLVEDIILNLRVGNPYEHFKGYKELYSTPLLNKGIWGKGLNIKTLSGFFNKMIEDFNSHNFELELSTKIPDKFPYYENIDNKEYVKIKKEEENKYYSSKYGFYINNFRLGDLEVISDGAPQNIEKYFEE